MGKESKSIPAIALKDVGLFQGLSLAQLTLIQARLRESVFGRGEMLFCQEKQCERIFIVQSGRVKIFRTTPAGREQILEILGPGDSCACNPGETVWSCSASAQALTSCRLWLLSRVHYAQLMSQNSQLSRTLNKIMAERLSRFCSFFETISFDNSKVRLVKFILNMLEDREERRFENAGMDISFTHEEIAQRIGLARETVTRHLNQLKLRKFIDIKPHRIIIRDRKGLENFLAV